MLYIIGRVVVWREAAANQWVKIFEDIREQASINSVAWAPHTFGLILTAASADGQVAVYTRKGTLHHITNNAYRTQKKVVTVMWCHF